MIVSVSKGTYL